MRRVTQTTGRRRHAPLPSETGDDRELASTDIDEPSSSPSQTPPLSRLGRAAPRPPDSIQVSPQGQHRATDDAKPGAATRSRSRGRSRSRSRSRARGTARGAREADVAAAALNVASSSAAAGRVSGGTDDPRDSWEAPGAASFFAQRMHFHAAHAAGPARRSGVAASSSSGARGQSSLGGAPDDAGAADPPGASSFAIRSTGARARELAKQTRPVRPVWENLRSAYFGVAFSFIKADDPAQQARTKIAIDAAFKNARQTMSRAKDAMPRTYNGEDPEGQLVMGDLSLDRVTVEELDAARSSLTAGTPTELSVALEHFTRELGAFVGNYKERSGSFNIDAGDNDRSVIAETRYRALIQMGNLLCKMHAAWRKVAYRASENS